LNKPIIGITIGDVCGIGPEIAVKAVLSDRVYSICNPLIIGSVDAVIKALQLVRHSKVKVHAIASVSQAKFLEKTINIFDLNDVDLTDVETGKINAQAGKAAVEYVEKAIELALNKQIDAIATAPINKEAIHRAGCKFPGHTELLAHHTKTKEYAMMFVSDELKVINVTTHIPLSQVPSEINTNNVFRKIILGQQALLDLGIKNPRIAVAGLNPHAGEEGLFGKEDEKIIKPAVERAKAEGINASGPISPDAVFYLAKIKMYDLVVAMYHDQGLIPLKVLSFGKSVNMTVGLPIIRTSVDHGTGFDIVGRGWANPESMIAAISLAAKIFQSRKN
jgi:4-hydroxythreonine-4-phosphate dehydrogenase